MCINTFKHKYFDPIKAEEITIDIPCGHCLECARRKQSDWQQRIQEELKYSFKLRKKCIWGTLTYDEKHVPKSMPFSYTNCSTGESIFVPSIRTLRRKDVIKWLKACNLEFRRKTGKPAPRYYVIGEYGSRTFRPHYHFIFFGLSTYDYIKYYRSYWTEHYGKIQEYETVKITHGGLSNYLCKYVCKPEEFDFYSSNKGLIERPRVICSNGFGEEYCRVMKDWHLATDEKDEVLRIEKICDRLHYVSNKYNLPLARYVYKKIFGSGFENLDSYYLRNEVKNLLQSRINQIFADKFAELEMQYPDFSPFEVAYMLESREKDEHEVKRKNIQQYYSSFYSSDCY